MKMNLSKTMNLWHSKDFWLCAMQKLYDQGLSSIIICTFTCILSSQWSFEFGSTTPILQVRKLKPRRGSNLEHFMASKCQDWNHPSFNYTSLVVFLLYWRPEGVSYPWVIFPDRESLMLGLFFALFLWPKINLTVDFSEFLNWEKWLSILDQQMHLIGKDKRAFYLT